MAVRLSPETRARVPRLSFFGTPVHPPLTDLPVTLFTLAPALDWAAVVSGRKDTGRMGTLAALGGMATAVPTSLTGALDWLRIPAGADGKAKGSVHASMNSAALACSAASLWLRRDDHERPDSRAAALSTLAAALVGISAHLGGELAYKHGIRAERATPLH